MKSINIAALAQLLLASTAAAAHCKPTPVSSASVDSSVGSAASYTPPASSSSAGGSNGVGNSAATYTPPSGVSYSIPSFSQPPPPPSSSAHSGPNPPVQSVSPCGQLISDPEFALGGRAWAVDKTNGGTLVYPGSAGCSIVGDTRTACGEFSLGTTDQTLAHVGVSQTISTPGAIVDGEKYQVYVQYRLIANTPVDTVTVNLVTVVDGSESFDYDLTNESPVGQWVWLHYEHTAIGTSMDVSVALTGFAGTAGAGFATTIQIGEINVVGCRSAATSVI
ncbi:hypothetical protein Sste5346_008997 [Sporothrix stenoceras]|uniref:CBM-cenC domain-containing protein n=1 Tax=Sporothrix stenoceras TaxID=5173 RepID=A0ABR3YN00_9PEZI